MANQKPVTEVRIGRVKAAIWQNETEGRKRHNVTFSCLYKDGNEFKALYRYLLVIAASSITVIFTPTKLFP